MDKAVSYVRFSPRPGSKDPEDHESPKTQRDRIDRYCRFRGLEIVKEFADPLVSARKELLEERPGGKRMLAYVKRHGIKHIVVQKWDRAFRDGLDGMTWVKRWRRRKISLHLADEDGNSLDVSTATGWLMIWIRAGFAQFEPMQTGERTALALRRYQSDGKRVSRVLPYGYMAEANGATNGSSGLPVRMVACPEEQAIIAMMQQWHAEGLGMLRIAKRLTAEGILCRGRPGWHVTTVTRIFKRLRRASAASESQLRAHASA